VRTFGDFIKQYLEQPGASVPLQNYLGSWKLLASEDEFKGLHWVTAWLLEDQDEMVSKFARGILR
jgi:hypothetical protein